MYQFCLSFFFSLQFKSSSTVTNQVTVTNSLRQMESIKNFDYDDAKLSVQTSSENTPTKKPGEPAEIEVRQFTVADK